MTTKGRAAKVRREIRRRFRRTDVRLANPHWPRTQADVEGFHERHPQRVAGRSRTDLSLSMVCLEYDNSLVLPTLVVERVGSAGDRERDRIPQ